MTSTSSHDPDGVGRRNFLRAGALLGLGAAALGSGTLALTRAAKASVLPNPESLLNDEYTVQAVWRYCTYCKGLYWPSGTPNICAANASGHGSASPSAYAIPFDGAAQGNPAVAGSAGVQVGWRFCYNCQLMFWGPAQGTSNCFHGGSHQYRTADYTYDIPFGTQPQLFGNPLSVQPGWAYCDQCKNLFWANGGGKGTRNGVCVGYPYTHLNSSVTNYALPF